MFYAEITAQLASARLAATTERERLVRAMGLWGDDLKFRLPDALPPLPRAAKAAPSIEVEAIRRRIDVQIARVEVETLAKTYGLTGATRFINLLEVGGRARRMQEPGGEPVNQSGAGVEFQIPLFDFGETRVRQAEATYMQAVNRLAAKAVTARSEAREAYQTYRSAYDIARHYQREVLPLRKIISDETLLRYNAMQIDIFALLAEARQRIASTTAAIAAERDFWLADVNLRAAVTGGGTVSPAAPATTCRGGSVRGPRLGAPHDHVTTRICRPVGGDARRGRRRSAAARRRPAFRRRPVSTGPAMQPPLAPADGQSYQPVVTLNGWTLPWRMKDGWKEFHLVAEPVVREMAPGMKAHLWGYNGASPGPTIEAVEGDKVRIFVTNKLPEHTTVHWHGMLLPNGMDGVGGLTQPQIKPGKTFVYEFVLKKSGTFMYHPHADEMVQMAMGMMGLFIIHPKRSGPAPGRSRFPVHHAELRHRPRQLHAEGHDDDRLQPVDLEQPRVSGHRSAGGAARRPRARARRQPHDDQPSDPPARPQLRGDRHRRRLGARRARAFPRSPPTCRSAPCAPSSSSPTSRATGRSTATSRITP